MLFRRKQDPGENNAVTVVRDVVEIVAIVAAGIWAFYVFAYENRIKPSLADPDVNVAASMQRLGTHNGFIAVSLRLELRNVGTVKAHFLGLAVNVYGQRIVAAAPKVTLDHPQLKYEFRGFYRTQPPVPVYSWAYITRLGNPSTGQETTLDPGTMIENQRTFYVPQGRFDLLTLGIEAPYTKFDETIPTHLSVDKQGAVAVVASSLAKVNQYNIKPLTSIDIR
jgi:hypothetical protein